MKHFQIYPLYSFDFWNHVYILHKIHERMSYIK